MMAAALGGRWNQSTMSESGKVESSPATGDSEAPEGEVVEPSEVLTDGDPWKD